MKRIFLVVLSLFIVLSNLNIAGAVNNHYISENEFLNLVESSPKFTEFEHLIYNSDYEVVEIQASESEFVGRMARIEIEYNQDKSKIVNQMSYLVFIYEYESGTFTEQLVDNSQLYELGEITIKNFNDDTQEVYDVSNEDFYKEYTSMVEKDIEKSTLDEKDFVELDTNEHFLAGVDDKMQLLVERICFQCTQYVSSPNDLSDSCMTAFSWACGAVGTVPAAGLPGFLICGGIALLSCWVPAYKVCVAGQWVKNCPIQA